MPFKLCFFSSDVVHFAHTFAQLLKTIPCMKIVLGQIALERRSWVPRVTKLTTGIDWIEHAPYKKDKGYPIP